MTALHADYKRAQGWLVWCHSARQWVAVRDGCCSACQVDVSDRIKAAA